jgi:sugar lactone lactonase YvrE
MTSTISSLSVVASGFTFLEGPRWHEGRLWASDMYGKEILAISSDGEVERIAFVRGEPSGLGWLPDGDLLAVSMHERSILRVTSDEALDCSTPWRATTVHADLSDVLSYDANEMIVDDQGRAYVGNHGFAHSATSNNPAKPTRITLVDPDGTARMLGEEIWGPNGMALTPDGRRLIVADSLGNRISAFQRNPDGTLGARSDFAVFGPHPKPGPVADMWSQATYVPDGITVDAGGAVWFADAIGNRAVRVAEGGEVLDEIRTGDLGVFAVALGGAQGDTLFLCASLPVHQHAHIIRTRSSKLLSTRVEVPAVS